MPGHPTPRTVTAAAPWSTIPAAAAPITCTLAFLHGDAIQRIASPQT
ncbi:MAG: hypothetical protein R2873_34630 [Caldilineaceae bacterium]